MQIIINEQNHGKIKKKQGWVA